ncbi:hypothetical protein P168DRAFT_312280 [Aspergillus campestris IBT 28561]|uniref:AB hydrolase-1 domain-containing protein n=1 Tax=Aspergillus campestris (strain IBT 28561) TaxID=1392248 RepID=A0A2I1CWQ5_ASPC2|nr:uncharacterized protein P168DRAFT_312280 [Aspergillus campestris IBT 28561]PKY02056.1 hypothetical protein P168DRAFT_312280 [Aspergillus campestris IBT 28561]
MTYLPSSATTFTIPSIYDGIHLDCRVYLPRELTHSDDGVPTWRVRGAIVAHPYAPLGGCCDDPVVSFVGGELLEQGYVVGTFNFRGAGSSEGRTSWTAKPELGDYVSFYGFMLLYLHILRIGRVPSGASPSGDTAPDVRIILGGYSYGSLIASHLPTTEAVMDLFRSNVLGTPADQIWQMAKRVSDETVLQSLSLPGGFSGLGRLKDTLDMDVSKVDASYLLVSPLLPPVNLFLTLFSNLSLEVSTPGAAHKKHVPCPKPADQLCRQRTLAIYGDDDTFTSAQKLRRWAQDMSQNASSKFQSVEVDGVGHFWREDGAEARARSALRNWVRQIP